MNRTSLLRISVLAAVSIALAGTPESSLAQRGGFHGGGGGFHGGGSHGGGFGGHGVGGGFGGFHNGGGFRGGSGFGDFHGGNFSNFNRGGFHNGFGGFRGHGFGGFRGNRFLGGYGGYPFSYGFDFGFWPYWYGYPYGYGYGSWWEPYAYSPYYYPYDPYNDRDYGYPEDRRCRPDYRHPEVRCNDAPSDHSDKPNGNNPPAKPSSTGAPENSPERNYVTRSFADERRAVPDGRIAAATPVGSNYQLANFTAQQLPSELRPAVRNVIEALRAMPPDARERQLKSGRYDGFSPEEREVLINASQAAQVN